MLAAVGIIKAEHAWFDVEHINEALQNAFVCVEMVFFAMIQMYAYSANPYKSKSEAKSKWEKKEQWNLTWFGNTHQFRRVLNNESAIMVGRFRASIIYVWNTEFYIWELYFGYYGVVGNIVVAYP